MWSPIEERMMPERGDRLPEQRSLLDWLEEDVDQEELAAGEAKIEAAVEKARQAAPEAGNGTRAAPAASKTPMRVDAVSRPDLLLPVVQSVREHPAKEAAQLAFGGLSEGRDDLAEAQLPLLPGSVGPRVPLLDLVDFRGGPIMARGRGAPLDLRLLVAACIMSPHDARKSFLALAVSVRLLRDFCFPNGWERRRHWPAIRRALWKARDYVIPNGRGGWNLPFLLAEDPGRDAALDDQVVLIVKLPRGSGDGPVIDRRELARLGVESAPRFRAYIAAHSVAWRPGVTRRRHPRNQSVHLWSSDPAHYPVLTAQDRRRLAFGAHDKKNRLTADQETAWENLPGIEILTRAATTQDGRKGWVIVPEAAAVAIRKTREEGDNRRKGGRQPENFRATTGEL